MSEKNSKQKICNYIVIAGIIGIACHFVLMAEVFVNLVVHRDSVKHPKTNKNNILFTYWCLISFVTNSARIRYNTCDKIRLLGDRLGTHVSGKDWLVFLSLVRPSEIHPFHLPNVPIYIPLHLSGLRLIDSLFAD